jgi:hypothetical protein
MVVAGTRQGWWRPLPAPHGDTAAFIDAAKARFAAESKGNIALALLANGRVVGTYFASHGKPVDGQSLFQVASLSKAASISTHRSRAISSAGSCRQADSTTMPLQCGACSATRRASPTGSAISASRRDGHRNRSRSH